MVMTELTPANCSKRMRQLWEGTVADNSTQGAWSDKLLRFIYVAEDRKLEPRTSLYTDETGVRT